MTVCRYFIASLICVIGIAFIPAHASALPEQRALALTPGESQFEVGTSLKFLKDSKAELNLEQVLSGNHNLQWQSSQTRVPNHGLVDDVYWFSLTLENPTGAPLSRYLEISYPLLGYVDIHILHDGSVRESIRSGAYRPFDTRKIDHRNLLADLNVAPGERVRVLIRAATAGPFQIPINVREPNEFIAQDQKALTIEAGFIGLMIAMAIYNLLVFFTVRDRSYLWYVIHVLGITAIIAMLDGLAFQHLWPNHAFINEYSMAVAIGITIMSASAFAYVFLNVQHHPRWLGATLRSLTVFGGFLVVLSLLTPYAVAIKTAMAFSIVAMPTLIGAAIYLWYQGEILARFYTVAWALLLAGNALLAIEKLGIIPYVPGMNHVPQAGAAMEVMLLSFALAYRIRLERQQRFEAQARQLEAERVARTTERNAKEELEHRVLERTRDLEDANRKLREISAIDGLTQVRNRRTFDDLLLGEWNRAARQGTLVSLLMLDMDHFKLVNDRHGHQCGDAALQQFARICESVVERAGDRVARYGGEEFAVLLPGTDTEGAHYVAERIRQRIEGSQLDADGVQVSLSVSIGVATRKPLPGSEPGKLIKAADQALYAAKDNGRNCVICEQSSS